MEYVLIGLCAVSLVLNVVLASFSTRTMHWANYYKAELLKEQRGVRPVVLKHKVPVETLNQQDWEDAEWDAITEEE